MSIFSKTIVLIHTLIASLKLSYDRFGKYFKTCNLKCLPSFSGIRSNCKSIVYNFKRNCTKQNLLFLTIIISFGFYVGYLFFGHNSLTDLLTLQAKKEVLEMRTEALKERNAKLHKKYFEFLIIHNSR